MGVTEAKVRNFFKKKGMANRLSNDLRGQIRFKGMTTEFDKERDCK